MQKLNKTTVDKIDRPVKVLQFGEGNFLRAFVDWQIDLANEAGVTDFGVAICKPREEHRKSEATTIDMLCEQDNMYHVYLEGIENRKIAKEVRIVKSVMDSFNPYDSYEKYMSYALSEELRFIVSNTTEAGIRYEEGGDITATPPVSFPAKIVALLYNRYKHFNGDKGKGLIILCCELIEDNGTTLHSYVVKHAVANNLESDFIDWVESACIFCDTLVDRIVPGFPHDTIGDIKEEIGFDDNLVVKGELYHLWVIGGKGYEQVKREFPLDKAGMHVIFMESIKEFRDKKVRILNGSHTGMVPVALQMGKETVVEAFNTPEIEKFIRDMVSCEVIPMINEERAELESFTASILERFYNPYIKHMLGSIALNCLSKWEVRNYPTLKDNWFKAGRVAKCECFTFAALMTLYSGKSDFAPNDTPAHVAFIQDNWDSGDIEGSLTKIIDESGIFTVKFSEVPSFIPQVAEYVKSIEELGMAAALDKFLG